MRTSGIGAGGAPIPLTLQSYGGTYGTKRALNKWKYKRRPAKTTLNGAITAGAASLVVSDIKLFTLPSGNLPTSFPIIIDNEQMTVVAAGGTSTTWFVVRGVNGTTAAAHSSGAVVKGKSTYDVVCIGDSTVQCTTQGVDGWVERLRTALSVDVGGGGTLLSSGFLPLWRCGAQVQTLFGLPSITNSGTEWSFAGGGWFQQLNGANDLMPFGGQLLGLANAANIATLTFPTFSTVASVDIFLILTTASGQGSYSTDGGTTWTNIPGNTVIGSGARVERVNVTIPGGATSLKVRCADSAAVAHSIVLAGAQPWAVVPTFGTTTGVVVHNVGADGQVLIGNNVNVALDRTNSGDNYGLFDGQPGSLQPDLVIVGPFSNDTGLVADATIATHLQNVISRVAPYADVLGVIVSEQDRTAMPTTLTTTAVSLAVERATSLAQRTQMLTNNLAVLDVFDAFAAEGDNGFTAANADGLMFDNLHWSALACTDVAGRVARLLLGGF